MALLEQQKTQIVPLVLLIVIVMKKLVLMNVNLMVFTQKTNRVINVVRMLYCVIVLMLIQNVLNIEV